MKELLVAKIPHLFIDWKGLLLLKENLFLLENFEFFDYAPLLIFKKQPPYRSTLEHLAVARPLPFMSFRSLYS
jgi:hypothetical protein